MKKHTIKAAALLLCAVLLLSALSLGAFAVNEARVEGDYYVLSKADYEDKTRAAYLAKLTSFFTDTSLSGTATVRPAWLCRTAGTV